MVDLMKLKTNPFPSVVTLRFVVVAVSALFVAFHASLVMIDARMLKIKLKANTSTTNISTSRRKVKVDHGLDDVEFDDVDDPVSAPVDEKQLRRAKAARDKKKREKQKHAYVYAGNKNNIVAKLQEQPTDAEKELYEQLQCGCENEMPIRIEIFKKRQRQRTSSRRDQQHYRQQNSRTRSHSSFKSKWSWTELDEWRKDQSISRDIDISSDIIINSEDGSSCNSNTNSDTQYVNDQSDVCCICQEDIVGHKPYLSFEGSTEFDLRLEEARMRKFEKNKTRTYTYPSEKNKTKTYPLKLNQLPHRLDCCKKFVHQHCLDSYAEGEMYQQNPVCCHCKTKASDPKSNLPIPPPRTPRARYPMQTTVPVAYTNPVTGERREAVVAITVYLVGREAEVMQQQQQDPDSSREEELQPIYDRLDRIMRETLENLSEEQLEQLMAQQQGYLTQSTEVDAQAQGEDGDDGDEDGDNSGHVYGDEHDIDSGDGDNIDRGHDDDNINSDRDRANDFDRQNFGRIASEAINAIDEGEDSRARSRCSV